MNRARLSFLSLTPPFLLALLLVSPFAHSDGPPQKILILSSASLQGELVPCG